MGHGSYSTTYSSDSAVFDRDEMLHVGSCGIYSYEHRGKTSLFLSIITDSMIVRLNLILTFVDT